MRVDVLTMDSGYLIYFGLAHLMSVKKAASRVSHNWGLNVEKIALILDLAVGEHRGRRRELTWDCNASSAVCRSKRSASAST